MKFKAGAQCLILVFHYLIKIKEIIGKYLRDVELKIKRVPLCRIEEINLEEKIIVIYCRGIGSPIKLNFNEIISDEKFLANFSVKQAAWIGYYYGKHYEERLGNASDGANQKPIDFSIDSLAGDSNPITLNRFGELIVSDKIRGGIRAVSPANLIRDNKSLMQFTPLQACFIGILAGTSSAKNSTSKSNYPSATKLTLVK